MAGTSLTQAQPTQPNIPPELKPLTSASVAGTIAAQQALPLTSFTTPQPLQVPGLTPDQQALIGQQVGMATNPFSSPYTGLGYGEAINVAGGPTSTLAPWMAAGGMPPLSQRISQGQMTPLSTSLAAGQLPDLAAGVAQGQMTPLAEQLATQPLSGTEAFRGLSQNFQDLIAPMVKQQALIGGTPLESGAMDQALAMAAEQAALPLAQQAQQIRAGLAGQELGGAQYIAGQQLAGTQQIAGQQLSGAQQVGAEQFQALANLAQQSEAQKAGLVPQLLTAGPAITAQAQQAAQMPWDIASQQAQAAYNEFQRLFNLAQQTTLGPTQTILPAMVQPGMDQRSQYKSALGISK